MLLSFLIIDTFKNAKKQLYDYHDSREIIITIKKYIILYFNLDEIISS